MGRIINLRFGFIDVMPLDPGSILAGVTGAPVAFRGARLRALAGIRLAVLVTLWTGFVLFADRSPLNLPGTATRTIIIFCHIYDLLS